MFNSARMASRPCHAKRMTQPALMQASIVRGQGADDEPPEPATSVPSANVTRPLPTADAEPEEEPPGMKRSSKGLRATP